MKALRSFICISGYLHICTSVSAQSASPDVIASAGDHFSVSAGSVSWTIGEPVVDTYNSSINILTKGFHQPLTISLSAVGENEAFSGFAAFPNPVTDQLQLDLSKMDHGVYDLFICDVAGKEVKTVRLENTPTHSQHSVAMNDLSSGIYLLKLLSENDQIFVFRVIRN